MKHTSHITSSPDPTTLAAASTATSTAAAPSTAVPAPAPAPADVPSAKAPATGASSKKESVLVYSNNDVSVEEVRAALERYRFKPQVESAA
ncbi:hypothetical protein BGZ70_005907 [Mortierella alpina]|uniref:Uncharacterized protein n=1 Tax=Mortierella alpina TaxID=64518 RepID=A0A9P6IQZ6_MORAP|nr:hypothetical protein BGZ70_005907 [Mortierella alpina]